MKLFTIPNIITLGNLVCGMLGIQSAIQGDLKTASSLIFLALILDFLDGFVARTFKSYSEIGKQLDSLADMVSFGALPSFILFYLLQDTDYVKYLALAPALFSALRLAKFNIDERQTTSFRGVPTPANAMVVASFPFILEQNLEFLNPDMVVGILGVYIVLISYLLIADFELFSLKFKNYSWVANRLRYVFLITSLILLVTVKFMALPFILLIYVVLSLLFKTANSTA